MSRTSAVSAATSRRRASRIGRIPGVTVKTPECISAARTPMTGILSVTLHPGRARYHRRQQTSARRCRVPPAPRRACIGRASAMRHTEHAPRSRAPPTHLHPSAHPTSQTSVRRTSLQWRGACRIRSDARGRDPRASALAECPCRRCPLSRTADPCDRIDDDSDAQHQRRSTRASTSSANASDAVSPGDSTPSRCTRPGTPCCSGPAIRKSAAASVGPEIFGRIPV